MTPENTPITRLLQYPPGHHIFEFFTEGSPCYIHKCWAPAAEAPGVFFAYCNMNYCLLGNVIENASGQRFDRKQRNGIVYIVGGTGSDKNQYFGQYSTFYGWEEALLTAAAAYAQFNY